MSFVAGFSISRGRQDEMEKTGTGTATVTLNDTEGLFEPTNTGSPYFDIIDGKQAGLAIWNPVDDEWVTVFRGFVEGYNYDVSPSGVVTRMTADLVDGMDYLAGVELAPGTAGHALASWVEPGNIYYEPDEVDERINAILTNADWPLDLRTIFSGNVDVMETVYPPGTTALQMLQDAADAEFPGVANIYVSKTGLVTFHGRHARFDPDGVSAGAGGAWPFTRWKAGDGFVTESDPDYAQIRQLSFARNRKNIINAAMATPWRPQGNDIGAAVEDQIVTDGTSITAYGVRSWSAENLLTLRHKTNGNTDLQETKLFAEYYVANYKDPRSRITQLGFRSIRPEDERGPATWALLTGVEISDIIELSTVHPGGGGFADEEFFVEGIHYEVRPLHGAYADITLTLDVSPAAYWTGDPFDD